MVIFLLFVPKFSVCRGLPLLTERDPQCNLLSLPPSRVQGREVRVSVLAIFPVPLVGFLSQGSHGRSFLWGWKSEQKLGTLT